MMVALPSQVSSCGAGPPSVEYFGCQIATKQGRLLLVHGPIDGDAVFAAGPAYTGGLSERASAGHTTHPVGSAAQIFDSRSGEACDAAQAGATAEHRIIAM